MLRPFYKKLTVLCVLLPAMLGGCSVGSLMQAANSAADTPRVQAPARAQRDYRKAVSALQAGNYEQAEAALQSFVTEYPGYANAYVNLAIVVAQRGDNEAAVRLLQHAIEVDAGNVYALNRLGLIRRQQGEFAAAEQAWLEATRVNPDYPNAWYNLGVLYDLYLQDLDAAVNHYQRYHDLAAAADFATETETAGVQRWIADLQRRIGDAPKTANATETL